MGIDEYSILRKKRKKNGFATTSLLISIALALLVLVGAVLILGRVSNKNLNAVNDDSDMTLGSKPEVTCVTLTKEMIFNNNIRNIKEAAISYFTNERLPKNIGDTVKITLKDMLKDKLVLNVIDSANKLCYEDKTFVEVTKEKNEYVMKIFLSCSDMEDYILVHLGCYDYCDSNVCEKKEEVPKNYEYEYKKTTSCTMNPWSNWGEWKLAREKTSNLKKEDTKTETKTKDKVDIKEATKNVSYNCDKYDGYTLVNDKCVKETAIKDTKDATKVVTYDCKKYSGYTLTSDNKCYKETTTKDTKDATKVVTYDCKKYSGYTLKDNKCVKETTTKDIKDAAAVTTTQTVKEKYTCYVNECTTKTVFACPSGQGCGNYPETSCEKVKKTCTRNKEEHTTSYNCNNYTGYTLTSDHKCVKEIKSTDTKDATQNVSYNCNKYDGYTLTKDNKCYKETTTKDTKTATQNVSYNCNKYDGYTLSEDKCIKTSSNTDTLDATKKVTYTCPKDYDKTANNTCKKTTTEKITTTYYRYATRTCTGGSTSIKWSTSKNDSILISEGYKPTGVKREIIVK